MVIVKQTIKDAAKVSAIPALIASLCCLSPVILVSLGIISVSVASEITDILYGEYKWAFRVAGLAALAVFLVAYIRRKKNICTLDDAKKRKNEIINAIALALITGTTLYIIFLYGIIEALGTLLNIW